MLDRPLLPAASQGPSGLLTHLGCSHRTARHPTGSPADAPQWSDRRRSIRGRTQEPFMTRSIPRLLRYVTVGAGVTAASYVGLVTGACPLDLGVGRRVRSLGPQLVDMAAPREVVFDVIAQPYLGRGPRAVGDELPA